MTDAAPLVATLCDVCEQTDPDPKIHAMIPLDVTDSLGRTVTIASPSYHFDCTPQEVKDLLDGDPAAHAVTIAAIDAAENGTKGQDLREFIQAQPSDNEVVNADPAQEG